LLLFMLAVLLAAGFAPAPLPRPRHEARSAGELLGRWKGRTFAAEFEVVITADRMDYNGYLYALVVDPGGRARTFDLTGVGAGNQGWEFRGIYQVRGDVLTLCYAAGTGSRPASFDSPAQTKGGPLTVVLQRVR
jgi:uncharacterized protein (TIGR03067 family)